MSSQLLKRTVGRAPAELAQESATPHPANGIDRPTFSVIVPTHKRPAELARCLRALAAQAYPRHGFEVIVVNDGGSPETDAVAETFKNEIPLQIISQPQRGPASARNAGVAYARGTYIAFTDDDCEPAPGWLEQLGNQLAAGPSSAIGGQTINALAGGRYSAASQLLVDYLYEYYHVKKTSRRFFTTNNLALAADDFLRVGGFDERFPHAAAEDREFCERWQRHGLQMVYAEGALVYHSHRLDLFGFVRQHFNYGRGADVLYAVRAANEGDTVRTPKLEPATFYVDLVLFPFTRCSGRHAASLTALMFLTQAAYGTGYFAARISRMWSPRSLAPIPAIRKPLTTGAAADANPR